MAAQGDADCGAAEQIKDLLAKCAEGGEECKRYENLRDA